MYCSHRLKFPYISFWKWASVHFGRLDGLSWSFRFDARNSGPEYPGKRRSRNSDVNFWVQNSVFCNLWPFGYVFCHTGTVATNNGKRSIFLDKVQKSIWGPVKWQVISAILILFNVYGFSNKSSPEIIKLSLNPFITNAPSASDGQCETKYTVQLVYFLVRLPI